MLNDFTWNMTGYIPKHAVNPYGDGIIPYVAEDVYKRQVLIAVAVLFTLIVFLYLCHISRCFQVLIPSYGAVDLSLIHISV